MKSFIQDLLKTKGVQVTEEHLDILSLRWAELQKAKVELRELELAESELGLTHIQLGVSHE